MRIVAAVALAAILASAPSEDITLTATSVNVAQPGTPVKIKILRWSTDEERALLISALSAPATPPPAPTGRGGAAAGRGRGRGRGATAAPLSPIAAFTAALGRAQTIGYIWTNDITGYAIKYAWHSKLPDGSARIVLASDRRLGAYTGEWKTAASAQETEYTFTLIELHVGPTGGLEGKTSLTQKVVVDGEVKSVVLDNYPAGTVTLTGKPAATSPRPPVHP
jgi:hypothetical protein